MLKNKTYSKFLPWQERNTLLSSVVGLNFKIAHVHSRFAISFTSHKITFSSSENHTPCFLRNHLLSSIKYFQGYSTPEKSLFNIELVIATPVGCQYGKIFLIGN